MRKKSEMAKLDIPKQRSGVLGTGGLRRGSIVRVLSPTRAYVTVPRLYEDAVLEAAVAVLPRTPVAGDRVYVECVEGRWDDLVVIGLEL